MIKNRKKYFSFFGILASSVNRKIHSQLSVITAINIIALQKIMNLLHKKQLKPINQYSTNNI